MITKSHLPALLALYHTVDDRVHGRHLRETTGCSYARLADLEDAGLVDGETFGPDDGRPRGRTYKLTEDGERFVDAVQAGEYVMPTWFDRLSVFLTLIMRPTMLVCCGALMAKGMWWWVAAGIAVHVGLGFYFKWADERWL